MTSAILECRAVSVRFGAIEAVAEASGAIGSGEVVAIVGRNAAGKSTLLRAMGGLLVPAAGEVLLDGSPLARAAPGERARRIAFVAQRPVLAAAFTVRESVALGRFALPASPARIERAIAEVGLSDLAGRRYHELSVGQQQRAALARALAQAERDSILLLDEPFAAMDLGEVDRVLSLLGGHADGGGSVVVVLHDLALAAALADRIWLLECGRIADEGPVASVLAPERLAERFGVPFLALADGTPLPQWRSGRRDRPGASADPSAVPGQFR